MRRLLLCCALAVGLLRGLSSTAQTPSAYAGPVTAERIDAWLKSASAQEQAWGAYYVSQTKDASFLAELVRKAEAWETLPGGYFPVSCYCMRPSLKPETHPDSGLIDRRDAMTAILDAVILLGGELTPEALLRLAPDFPPQAAILLSRERGPGVEATLWSLYNDPAPRIWYQQRAAAQLLAKLNPPGFAASMLRATEVTGQVVVKLPGDGDGFNDQGNGATIAGGPGPPDSAWPKVGQYELRDLSDRRLVESNPRAEPVNMFSVVEGASGIVAVRQEGTRTWPHDPAVSLGELTTRIRIQLLAGMMGLDEDKIKLRAKDRTLIYTDSTGEYERQLRQFVAAEERKFAEIETDLLQRGLISRDDFAKGTRPRLHLELWDLRARDKRTFALPQLSFEDTAVDWLSGYKGFWIQNYTSAP